MLLKAPSAATNMKIQKYEISANKRMIRKKKITM